MSQNYVFLDFDGVLNCGTFIRDLHSIKITEDLDYQGLRDVTETLMHVAIENLNYLVEQICLVEQTRVEIVVSSSWRKLYTIKQLRNILMKNGFKYPEVVVDVTPTYDPQWNVPYCRGAEIKRWLEENDCFDCSFVIFDDDADMGELSNHLIKTEFEGGGLERRHVEEAISLLTSKGTKR